MTHSSGQAKAHLGPDSVSPHQDVALITLPTLQDGPDAALAKLIHLRQAGQALSPNHSTSVCKTSTNINPFRHDILCMSGPMLHRFTNWNRVPEGLPALSCSGWQQLSAEEGPGDVA